MEAIGKIIGRVLREVDRLAAVRDREITDGEVLQDVSISNVSTEEKDGAAANSQSGRAKSGEERSRRDVLVNASGLPAERETQSTIDWDRDFFNGLVVAIGDPTSIIQPLPMEERMRSADFLLGCE